MWQLFQVAEVAGAVLALRGRSVFRHVLRENVARRKAFHQQRADVADHGRKPVARFERVGAAHRNRFLSQARIEAADDFVLPEEAHDAVFELPVELHEVIQVEVLFAG